MAKLNRVKLLAEAVASSFEAAGYSSADLLQGQIVITDLVWQTPPLEVAELYWGVPFQDYLDYPLIVDSMKLHEFYTNGLFLLRHAPEEITTAEGYRGLSKVILNCLKGERKLALPLYENWPEGEPHTGPQFALEVARLFKTSSDVVSEFVSDRDNYYVSTPWGKVGITDGLVSHSADLWDVSCKGLVPGMLEQPRGKSSTECHYDVLARLRSALHQEPARFADFEMVDLGLQALRILSDGENCREVQQALSQMSAKAFKRRLKITAYQQAIDVMLSWSLTDRVKISMLQEILMPTYMSLPEFSRKILDPHKVMPAVLSRKTEARILQTLRSELSKVQRTHQALNPESQA